MRAAGAELGVTMRVHDEERNARVLGGAPRDEREVEGVLGARRAEEAPAEVRERAQLFAAVTGDGVRDDGEARLCDASHGVARRSERLGARNDRDALAPLGRVTGLAEQGLGGAARRGRTLRVDLGVGAEDAAADGLLGERDRRRGVAHLHPRLGRARLAAPRTNPRGTRPFARARRA